MSKTVTISDELFERLQQSAHQQGYPSVERLLECWQAEQEKRRRRFEVGERILALRKKIVAACGKMPDSAELIREDRLR